MTKKEKIATKIMYEKFLQSGSRRCQYGEVVTASKGKLSGPELGAILTNDKSRYIQWVDEYVCNMMITGEGIEYMENHKKRVIKEWAVIIASVLAAILGILSYLKY